MNDNQILVVHSRWVYNFIHSFQKLVSDFGDFQTLGGWRTRHRESTTCKWVCEKNRGIHCKSAEMPTSTFLPYFVRFLKENTVVRFFPPKYVFFLFFLFFYIFYIGEWKFYITHIIYVMKTWSEFLNDNVKKRLRLHQRAPKTHVFPGPLSGP